jgi:formylmethanofuran dehydrogenase subunit C
MLIELERVVETDLAIEVDGIVPDHLAGLSHDEIAKLPVWIGREELELGTIFQIRITTQVANPTDSVASEIAAIKVLWTGNLSNVHWIGAGMSQGAVEIESSAGHHVGYRMSGGTIHVRGSVGNYAGVEMQGGLLRIHGDAGDHLGGCHSGSKMGMNCGEIVVLGNAGGGVGQRMRRGLIAVGGAVERLCGWNMLAGTIIVIGNCGVECGSGMVRGTIIQCGEQNAPLLPTFSQGSTITGGIMGLLATRLRRLDYETHEFQDRAYCQFHGDHLNGGRGEIFLLKK